MDVGQIRHAQVPMAPARPPDVVRCQARSRKLPERLNLDFRTASRSGVELETPAITRLNCPPQLPAGNKVRTKLDWIRVTRS